MPCIAIQGILSNNNRDKYYRTCITMPHFREASGWRNRVDRVGEAAGAVQRTHSRNYEETWSERRAPAATPDRSSTLPPLRYNFQIQYLGEWLSRRDKGVRGRQARIRRAEVVVLRRTLYEFETSSWCCGIGAGQAPIGPHVRKGRRPRAYGASRLRGNHNNFRGGKREE